jgi:hypothetical protein
VRFSSNRRTLLRFLGLAWLGCLLGCLLVCLLHRLLGLLGLLGLLRHEITNLLVILLIFRSAALFSEFWRSIRPSAMSLWRSYHPETVSCMSGQQATGVRSVLPVHSNHTDHLPGVPAVAASLPPVVLLKTLLLFTVRTSRWSPYTVVAVLRRGLDFAKSYFSNLAPCCAPTPR